MTPIVTAAVTFWASVVIIVTYATAAQYLSGFTRTVKSLATDANGVKQGVIPLIKNKKNALSARQVATLHSKREQHWQIVSIAQMAKLVLGVVWIKPNRAKLA